MTCKIGLLYSYDDNWIGGTYYIQNLVSAFRTLPEKEQPELVIFTASPEAYRTIQDATRYPKMTHDSMPVYSLIERALNKMSTLIFGNRIVKKKIRNVDILFPVVEDQLLRRDQGRMFWIPDLQEHFLPEFCSPEEIKLRKSLQINLVSRKVKVIFSSQATRENYMSLYPNAKSMNYVVPFAVTHPDYNSLDIDSLKQKYGIDTDYFMSPNQFWAHKNHHIIVDALIELRRKGLKIKVVFTGKPHDYRNPDFFSKLKQRVIDNSLEDQILFLGFIDRAEQLKLMKHAIAIIQPSRFEGWSTVVEDAKAMNQFVIASGIAVHREQIQENVRFFDPSDGIQLGAHLQEINDRRPLAVPIDYKANVKKFAIDFLAAVHG